MVRTGRPFLGAVQAIQTLLGSSGEASDIHLRRKRLRWAMEAFVRLTLGAGNGKELGYRSLEGLTDRLDRQEVLDALSLLGKLPPEVREASGRLPVLFAVHFRSPSLEDGRATFAGTLTGQLEERLQRFLDRVAPERDHDELISRLASGSTGFTSDFHDSLLQMYRRLYTRPFSFNDRIFQIVANRLEDWEPWARLPSVWTVLFDFEAGPESPLLQAGEDAGHRDLRICLPAALVRDLNEWNDGDLRLRILSEVAGIAGRRVAYRPPKDLREGLTEAVEMVWHKVLAREGSFEQWNGLLHALELLKDEENPAPGWSSPARTALFDALRFLQGVSLYEILAPGGLSTTVVPGFDDCPYDIGAWTIGFPRSCEGSCRTQENLLPSAGDILGGLFSCTMAQLAVQGPERRENQLTLAQYLGDPDLGKGLLPRLPNEKHEACLIEVLKLCMRLCHEKHEQIDLYFRFFLGRSVDLARFNEVYVFGRNQRDEQAEFRGWEEDKRARCLKAHYSHLQDPRIGLFFDWEKSVHFRFVEIVEGKRSPLPQGTAGLHDDRVEMSRSSLAKKLTAKAPGLIVADAGGGKVHLYKDGEVVAAWPQNGSSSWWNPGQRTPWNSKKILADLLLQASGQQDKELDPSHASLLSDALLWVSETSGLGCTLVLTGGNGELDRHRVSLNLKKLGWVDQICLADCEPRDVRNLLVQDGATILNLDSRCLTSQVQLVAFKDGRTLDPAEGDEERWTYGTRHASACDITRVVPSCTVITVSADGPISVFRNGEKIKKPEMLRWS